MNRGRFFWGFALVLAVLLAASFLLFQDLYRPVIPARCEQLSADAEFCVGGESTPYRPSSGIIAVSTIVALFLMLVSGVLGYRSAVWRESHG